MLQCLLSWIIILIYSYILGCTGLALLNRKQEKWHTVDIQVICGIVIINLYAQIFSVFYKVGIIAFVLLSMGVIICFFYLWHKNKIIWIKLKISKYRKIFLGIAILLILLWTCLSPQHYDTYLYHAQSIHWIEEYKTIPGLGNLHFRYAYNSAFLTLQALFSYSWLFGQSLHTVNGFLAIFMVGYVILTGKKQERYILSDWLKLGISLYVIYICFYLSSPSTDTWAILLTFYICIKWCEYVEEKVESENPYAFLCVLTVYAITLKLSAAPFLLLTLYPAIVLIQKRKIKEIIKYLLLGVLIIIPFLIKNVILSGYLIYPYPEIDIFNVDWKIPEHILWDDRIAIVVFGRQHMDISRYNESLLQWLPEWFDSIHIIWKIFLLITLISIVLIVINIKQIKKNIALLILILTSIAGIVFWILSAPLPRYGTQYMILIPCIAMGIIINDKIILQGLYKVVAVFMVLFSLILFPIYNHMVSKEKISFWNQNDYQEWKVQEILVDGYTFYVPIEGNDQTGYEPFPVGGMQSNEFRGETIEEGFRPTSYRE